MKHSTTCLMAFICIFFFSTTASAGWLVFHKPAFRGKVIDAETKESIEGAVVVAVYNTHTIISGPAGGDTSVIKVKETLTDKSGEFRFPSYTRLMQPNAIDFDTEFIIYRAGYGNFPRQRISPPKGLPSDTLEQYFLEDQFGKEGEVTITTGKKRGSKPRVIYGVVELPKMQTREERLRAKPRRPTDFGSKKLPLLYKAINEERKNLGLKGEIE
ncbi:MAG: hypothetical protein JXB42_01940 [Deltaproteobacteria bacterium]|nr:hypothetical protein [Deltaproteobacteria bacterium]